MLPKRLSLHGQAFEQVCVRRTGVAVYRGDDTYLRIGPGIEAELVIHRQLLEHGFPVAAIVAVGEREGSAYFVEESLGAITLGDRFDAELAQSGRVSAGTFDEFLAVAPDREAGFELLRRHRRASLL